MQRQLIDGVQGGCDARRSHDNITARRDQYVVGGYSPAFDNRLNDINVAGLTNVNKIVRIQRAQTNIAFDALCAEQAIVIALDHTIGGGIIDVHTDGIGSDSTAETVNRIGGHDDGEIIGVDITGGDDRGNRSQCDGTERGEGSGLQEQIIGVGKGSSCAGCCRGTICRRDASASLDDDVIPGLNV